MLRPSPLSIDATAALCERRLGAKIEPDFAVACTTKRPAATRSSSRRYCVRPPSGGWTASSDEALCACDGSAAAR